MYISKTITNSKAAQDKFCKRPKKYTRARQLIDRTFWRTGKKQHRAKESIILKINKGQRPWNDLRNADLAAHETGDKGSAVFFTAAVFDARIDKRKNPSRRTDDGAIVIDIDVKHGVGSTQGAIAFAQHLKNHYFPNLEWELSFGGLGINCYLIVCWNGRKDESHNPDDPKDLSIKKSLDRFEAWLKAEAEALGADISGVELKGRPNRSKWVEGVQHITLGSLGKLPVELEKLTRTHYTNLVTLDALQFNAPVVKRKRYSGSTEWISPEHVDKLRSMAGSFPNILLRGSRHVVAEDWAIMLLLLHTFYNKPNDDGSAPTKRFSRLWRQYTDQHPEARKWCHHKFKAMRDYLSQQLLIDWEDSTYTIGCKAARGEACKWQAIEQLIDEINDVLKATRSSLSSLWAEHYLTDVPRGSGTYEIPFLAAIRCEFREKDKQLRAAERRIDEIVTYHLAC